MKYAERSAVGVIRPAALCLLNQRQEFAIRCFNLRRHLIPFRGRPRMDRQVTPTGINSTGFRSAAT